MAEGTLRKSFLDRDSVPDSAGKEAAPNFSPCARPWMQAVSFAGLLRVLHLAAELPEGLEAYRLDSVIKERGVLRTRQGTIPARTTLYHYRNTLLHLQALRRNGRRLLVNAENPYVCILLDQPDPDISAGLNVTACEAFAALVLKNKDCRRLFFDLFTPDTTAYDVQKFRATGCPVTWQWRQSGNGREVTLQSSDGMRSLCLRSPSEIKSILYGLRYWARDELKLIDEFFREGRGFVMYPILAPDCRMPVSEVARHVLSLREEGQEWTTLSLRDLIDRCCEQLRQPLAHLFAAVRWLHKKHPGQIVLIPTSRSFATLTAHSRLREELELRSYLRDPQGRYISHIRLHSSIGRLDHANVSKAAGA